jgi:hypothetical protein
MTEWEAITFCHSSFWIDSPFWFRNSDLDPRAGFIPPFLSGAVVVRNRGGINPALQLNESALVG